MKCEEEEEEKTKQVTENEQKAKKIEIWKRLFYTYILYSFVVASHSVQMHKFTQQFHW